MLALYVVLLLALISAIESYPIWDPDTACNTMLPKNDVSSQSGTSPYKLRILAKDYRANDEIEVILSGETTFTGFLIKADLALSSDDDELEATSVGELSSNNTNSLCEGSAITEKEAIEKTSMSFVWKAPPTDVGPIVFRYSVVMNETTFWSNLSSEQLEFKNNTIENDISDGDLDSDLSGDGDFRDGEDIPGPEDKHPEDTTLKQTTTSKGTELGKGSGEKGSVASHLISSRWLFGISWFACLFKLVT